MLGHFKLLLILTAGIVFFHEDTNRIRLMGMALAFFGIVTYTTLKQNAASGWEKVPQNDKIEKVPLKSDTEESYREDLAIELK